MTLELLFIAMIMGVAWQPDLERMKAAGVFVGVTVGFDFLFQDVYGLPYYMAGAFFGLVIMYALENRRGTLAVSLQALCLVDIMANIGGACSHFTYAGCEGYRGFYLAFYGCVVSVLFAGGPYGWGNATSRLLRCLLRRRDSRGDKHFSAVAAEQGQ